MPRVSKTDQELGYVRSFWNEVKTFQAVYGTTFGLSVHLSDRPGVLVFRMEAASLLDASGEGMGTNAIQFEFPTPHKTTMAGALWAHAMKLSDLIEENDKRRQAASGKRRGKG